VEIEEETTRDIFNKLWRHTHGRRVHKRRYFREDGGLVWEIDQFLDRDLVLAEVELPAVDTPVHLPKWLEGHLVREVTGDTEFVNVNLAK
jgi:CYTH domain-containing protein